MLAIKAVGHVHVDARIDRLAHGIGVIGGEPLECQLLDAVPIGYDEPTKSPPRTEHVRQQKVIRRHRCAVEVVESAHYRQSAGPHTRLVGWQIQLPKPLRRNIGVTVVAAALGRAVAHEVLQAGGDRPRPGQMGALETAHGRRTVDTGRIGRFSKTLGNPAPPRIDSNIDHRGKRPIHPIMPSLNGRHVTALSQ